MTATEVTHLKFYGNGIATGAKVCPVIQPGLVGDRITTLLKLRFNCNDEVVCRALAERRARFKESIVDIRNVGPLVTVERHAEDKFPRLHTSFKVCFDVRRNWRVR